MVESSNAEARSASGQPDRAHLMVGNPERGFVYWSITERGREAAAAELDAEGAPILIGRLAVLESAGRVESHVEFELGLDQGHRFVEFARPGASHRFWVGLRRADGGFAEIAASSIVEAPRRGPGDEPATFVEFDLAARETGEGAVEGPAAPPEAVDAPDSFELPSSSRDL